MHNLIRLVLCESFEYQKKYRVSNACISVSIIADRILKMLNIPSEIVYGHITGTYIINHVWIRSNDMTIDFAYFEDIPIQITSPTTPDTFYLRYMERVEGIATDGYFQGDDETELLGIPASHHHEFVKAKNHPDAVLREALKTSHIKSYYRDMLQLGVYMRNNPNAIAMLSLKWASADVWAKMLIDDLLRD